MKLTCVDGPALGQQYNLTSDDLDRMDGIMVIPVYTGPQSVWTHYDDGMFRSVIATATYRVEYQNGNVVLVHRP